MDAWLCLKAGTSPGGLGLSTEVSGQLSLSCSPNGVHSSPFQDNKSWSFSSATQGWHLFNLKVKCPLHRRALPDYPTTIVQRPHTQLRKHSREEREPPKDILESSITLFIKAGEINCANRVCYSSPEVVIAIGEHANPFTTRLSLAMVTEYCRLGSLDAHCLVAVQATNPCSRCQKSGEAWAG